uniref:Maturase n=1 Tax=Phacus pleuronectes TaxID=102908 RepID=A0A3G3LLT0_9EUGL|nr:maturase [Phacus pleuronectes]AYQ93658.1 maturase [Phacus pleuronectes]
MPKLGNFNLFDDLTDVYFLFYSWLELKRFENFFIKFSNQLIGFYPVNKKWFQKTSFLLKNNKYVYSKSNKIKLNFFNLKIGVTCFLVLSFRNKIIENAIFNSIFPFFQNNYSFNNGSLIKGVRFLFKFYKWSISLIPLQPFFHFKQKSNFLKKVWHRKFPLESTFLKFRNFSSIHLILEKIRNWNTNMVFFLNCRILKGLIRINKNRLKNIFLKVIKDVRLWCEIEKMLSIGIISVSTSCIYRNFDFQIFNSLSYFLFNIFLTEFDFYIFGLSYQFNHCFYLKSLRQNVNFFCERKSFKRNLLPIKLNSRRFNLCSFTYFFNKDKNFFNFYVNSTFKFQKNLNYVRYLDYFFLGFVSTKFFSLKFKNKIITFLIGNLFLKIENIILFSNLDKNIFFLGYNIRFSSKLLKYSSSSLIKKNLSILNKLFFRKLNFSKIFLNNFYVHLSDNFKKFFLLNQLNCLNLENKNIWMYFIQLEAVRSFSFSKNIFNRDLIRIFSFQNVSYFSNYSFNLFLDLLKKNLKFNLFNEVLPKINKFVFSVDLYAKFLFCDFIKKYFFLLQNIINYKKNRKLKLRFYFLGKNFFFKNYFFSKKDIFIVSDSFSDLFYKSSLLKNSIFFLAPIKRIYVKLKTLGFIHSIKRRPIGNIKYMFVEDVYLIQFFSSLIYFLLIWFKFCFNFVKLNVLLKFIKKSCFLTLSRKHNRSKFWSYQVYTDDLIFFRGLTIDNFLYSINNCIFSTRISFFSKYFPFYFDELFFLNF